jgi:hypothetical protein
MDTKQMKLRILASALLFGMALTCLGAVSRIQVASANAATVSISSTSANDLILVFTYSSAGTTPTTATGYTSATNGSGTGQAFRAGYKVSAGGDTDCGTWTNATQIVCHVYRGALAIGTGTNQTFNNTAGTSATIPSITMEVTSGSSWVAAFVGAKTATSMTNSTTLLTNQTNVATACGLDSGTGLTAYAGETLTIPSSRYMSTTIEVKSSGAAPPPPSTNFLTFFKP